jgi:hypothetical protein
VTTTFDGSPRPVTRMEILDVVEDAFVGSWVSKDEILGAARDQGARPALLLTLERLDAERRFTTVRDMWADLADVPVDLE